MKRYGIVLFQLGGPDSLHSVEPFLYNIFSDPDIINFPFSRLFRKRLARFISKKRSARLTEHYRFIGGKSPIIEHTEIQRLKLEKKLNESINAVVATAMRYWKPFTHQAVIELLKRDVSDVVLIPLYPQYSLSATGSSLNEWNRAVKLEEAGDWNVKVVRDYPTHPLFIEAFVDRIKEGLNRFVSEKREDVYLLFSAHGTPKKLVRKGDPYKFQIEDTVNSIIKSGKFKQNYSIAYQSKVGPEKWLEPFTKNAILSLAKEGRKEILVIPVSFVSDHLETLFELNVEMRELALNNGIERFEITTALNDHPSFIDALADLALSAIMK